MKLLLELRRQVHRSIVSTMTLIFKWAELNNSRSFGIPRKLRLRYLREVSALFPFAREPHIPHNCEQLRVQNVTPQFVWNSPREWLAPKRAFHRAPSTIITTTRHETLWIAYRFLSKSFNWATFSDLSARLSRFPGKYDPFNNPRNRSREKRKISLISIQLKLNLSDISIFVKNKRTIN